MLGLYNRLQITRYTVNIPNYLLFIILSLVIFIVVNLIIYCKVLISKQKYVVIFGWREGKGNSLLNKYFDTSIVGDYVNQFYIVET